MNIAIVLAGGAGERVGAALPKQFIEVLGKPIVAYTIEQFQKHREIDYIEVVCIPEHLDRMNEIVRKYRLDKVKRIVEGGVDFQHSVINGVNGLDNIASPEDIVLIHWAASPFVREEEITDAIKTCREKGNCIAAYPAYLLYGLKSDEIGKSIQGIDRDTFMVMNAPQCFQFGYVKEMYEEAIRKGYLELVEPHTTTLMYKMGRAIYFSKGNPSSIKITTKDDFDTFLGHLLVQMYHAGELSIKDASSEHK